jgi:hypothetical protein
MPEKDPKEPLLREEYERRHKALQTKYETFARRTYRTLAVFFVGLLLTAGAAGYLINENGERSGEITESLVKGCKESGNSLRKTVRKFGSTLIEQTQRQIDQSKAFEKSGVLAEFLPNFTPEERHALVVKSRQEDRKTKRELRKAKANAHPVACEARYP